MQLRTWAAGGVLLALAAWLPAEAPLKLGAPFPADLPVPLAPHRGKQHVLLVSTLDPAVVQRTQAELAKLETALVVLGPSAPALERLGARPAAFLLDKEGVLRWVERGPTASRSEALVRLVRQWDRGKWSYDSQCARCHGADGNDTGYAPNIKKLGGLGNRLTLPQILEATAATGVVSFSGWTQDDLDALALYVAGL